MLFTTCKVSGVQVVDPQSHVDARGRFLRAWCASEFRSHGIEFVPLQANMGFSKLKGTIRGLHFQAASSPEAKLIRCTRGALFDVVVDLRPSSPTYLAWYGTALTAENARMLYLPEGCAHGCQTLEDDTEFLYMTSAVYSPEASRGARYDDPAFGIEWPMPASLVSEQDRNWPLLKQGLQGVSG